MEIDDLKINDPLADAPKVPVFYIIISPIVSSDVALSAIHCLFRIHIKKKPTFSATIAAAVGITGGSPIFFP